MNLQEFIKDVLVDIDHAVEAARGETSRDIKLSYTSEQRTVEFDIAVTAEDVDTKSGKAGIRVLQFAQVGGDLSKESRNSTVSRIKFGVFIEPLTKEEDVQQTEQMKQLDSTY